MGDMAAVQLPEPSVEPSQARRVVEDVLADPVYDPLQPSLLDRVIEAVLGPIIELLTNLGGTTPGGMIGYLLLAAILGLVVVASIRFLRGTRRDPAIASAERATIGRSHADWTAEAEEHESAGRWRDAVRCRYRAVIADLAWKGQVEEVPGRTAGEYLSDLRQSLPSAAEAFAELTVAFEVAWYGDRPVDAQDGALAKDAAQRTLRAASGHSWRVGVGAAP